VADGVQRAWKFLWYLKTMCFGAALDALALEVATAIALGLAFPVVCEGG
jgi:hypothetical protein